MPFRIYIIYILLVYIIKIKNKFKNKLKKIVDFLKIIPILNMENK